MRLLTGSFAAALVGVLTLSACGDDEDRLSADEFGERLAAACLTALEKGDEALPLNPPPDVRLTTDRVNDFAAALEEWAATVESLAAPESLQSATEKFHDELDALAGEFRQVAQDGGTEDDLFESINGLFPRFDELDSVAKPLGVTPLQTCGGRATPPPSEGSDSTTP